MRTAKAKTVQQGFWIHISEVHVNAADPIMTSVRPLSVFMGCRPSNQREGFLPKEASSEASNTTSSLASSAGHANVIIVACFSTLTVAFMLLLTCNLSWWVVASALQPLCNRDRLHPAGSDSHTSLKIRVYTFSTKEHCWFEVLEKPNLQCVHRDTAQLSLEENALIMLWISPLLSIVFNVFCPVNTSSLPALR